MITQAQALEFFSYDPETGIVRVKKHRCGGRSVGEIAGTLHPEGYWQIKFQYRVIKIHRLIWLMLYNEYDVLIDHINGDPRDNRLSNLRKCTVAQNAQNKRGRTISSSGRKGVHWETARSKWCACISVEGKTKFLGRFDCLDEAHNAYFTAAKTHFGEFARG
jgi:hypothetical protein